MSSHATPRDLERGRQVGFTDYVAKFNREGLLSSLHETLKQSGEHHE
jgi:two-component system chemotaxis sensor kinase CheA